MPTLAVVRRYTDLDVLACPRCGPAEIVTCVDSLIRIDCQGPARHRHPPPDPAVVRTILAHRAGTDALDPPGPAPTGVRRQSRNRRCP
jgi:hypothetical protein